MQRGSRLKDWGGHIKEGWGAGGAGSGQRRGGPSDSRFVEWVVSMLTGSEVKRKDSWKQVAASLK